MNRSLFLTLLATCVCGTAALGADDDGQSLRRVYVPIKDLETVFGGHRQGVLLPDHEFEDLYEAARRNAAQRGNAPAGAILTRADYDCRIDGEQLLVRVTGELKQFDRGWQQLSLPVGGLSLEAMTVAGQPAQVARHPEQADLLLLYVQEAGTHPVSAEFSAPLAAVGSDKAAGFQLFRAPSGRLGITLPAGKYLTFGGRQIERPAPADQEAVYSLPIGGLSDLQLRITEQQSQATGDALTFAQTAFGVYVAPGEVTWTAQTSLQVYGRTIDRLVCTVPNSLEITDVQSSGLDNWELADAEGERTSITLAYRQPFDGTRQITFRGVVRTDAQAPWSVPDLQIPSLTSHIGRVVVQHPPGVRLQLVESSGVRPVLAGAAENLFSLQYEVWEEDFALAFTTAAKEREVHAAMTNLLDVNAEGLDLYVTVDVRTLFAPLFDVRLQLPAEWTVTAASVAGAPITWETVSPQAGMTEVRLPLAPTLAIGESRQVVLTAHRDLENWPVEQDPVQFAIPEVRLPQAGVVEALYGITVDDDLDALPIDVTGLDPARADDVAQLDQQMSALGRKLRLGYAYQDTVFSGQLQISRKPSRVSAATIAFFRIDPESLFGHLEAHLNIEGGGVRVLQVSVSEAAGTDLRFQLLRPIHALPEGRHVQLTPVRIVEQQPADPADGRRIWTLQLDRRARGQLVLLADVQTPRGDAESYVPFSLEVVGADRQSGHLAIEAGNDQQVTVNATDADGAPLTTVDVVDFPPAYYRPAERVVAGYQFVRPGWQMTVSETRFDRNPVPTAVIHSARIASVLGKAGEFQHQADFEFTAVGVQNLKVQLPFDANGAATLWATLVDGNPVEARKADDGVLITLPQVEQPAARRSLRLMYRTIVDSLGSWSGQLLQTPPQISVVIGTGDTQPVDVLQQSWTIHHPPETLLVDSEGRFHPEKDLDRDSLLGRIAQWFRAPSPRDLWRNGIAVAIVIVICAVLAAGYRRFRLMGVALGCVILLIVAGVLTASMVIRNLGGTLAGANMQIVDSASSDGIDFDFIVPAEESPAEPDYEGMYAPAIGRYDDGAIGGPMVADSEPADEMGAQLEGRMGQLRDQSVSNAVDALAAPPTDAPAELERMEAATREPMSRPTAPPATAAAETPDAAPGESGEAAGRISESVSGAFVTGQPSAGGPSGGDGGGFGADFGGVIGQMTDQSGAPVPTLNVLNSRIARGALLSLSLDLQPPAGFERREFRYLGNASNAEPPDLNVTYADRGAGRLLTLAVAVALAAFCWFVRKRSFASRARLTLLVVLGPLALMTIAPVDWLPVLDGLFLGGIVGVGLWILRCVIVPCLGWCSTCCLPKTKDAAVKAALIAILVSLSGAARAQEAMPEPLVVPDPNIGGPFIVIPYEAGSDPTTADQVFVPQELFLKLWNEAHPDQRIPEQAPVAGLVAQALYAATLEQAGDDARVAVTARYVLHNLRPHQIVLPLPLGPVALRDSTLDGGTAAVTVGDSQLAVVLNDTGTHVLDVTFDVPAETTGPAGTFRLPLKPVSSGRLSFTLPEGDDLQVRVNGGTGTYRRRTAEGRTSIDVPIDRGGDVVVNWQPRTTRGAVMGVVQVESATAVNIDDAGLHVGVGLLYRVRQGTLNEVTLTLPEGLNLQQVAGPDVGGWELNDDAQPRTVRVFLRRTIEDETQLTIDFYQALDVAGDSAAFTAPQVVPQDVTRETGLVALYADEAFTLRAGAVEGAAQVNIDRFTAPVMPNRPESAPRTAFRFTARPATIPVTVARRQAQTRAVAEHGSYVGLRKLITASRIQFELTGAPKPYVSVSLPDGYLPIDVEASYLSDWYVTEPANGPRVLTIELDQPRNGHIDVLLEGHLPREPDDALATLDLPQPLEVSRLESTLAVWLDDAYTARLNAFDGWRSIDPDQLSQQLRTLQSKPVQFAFQSSQLAPSSVTLSVSRATPQLAGQSVTLIAVSDTSIDYGLTLRWSITQAASDEFTLLTPDGLGGLLEFTGAGIRQVLSEPTEDGQIRWSIRTIDPVRGEYLLNAVATLPPPDDGQVLTPELQFVQTDAAGTLTLLETQTHHAVLVNLSTQQLFPIDANQLEPAERDALPFTLRNDLLDRAMEIVRVRTGRVPSWQMQRLERVEAASATVTAAELVSVLSYDGSYRLSATYTVRNRGQQFLALRLPAGAKVLSVYVRGVPSRTVASTLGAEEIHLIALPQTSAADLSFPIRLLLAGQLAQALPQDLAIQAQELALPAPDVISTEESQELGVPVVQTQWQVYLPEDIDAAIVVDPSRTNVTSNADTWMLLLEKQKADITELTSIVRDPFASRARKVQAANNLKQLGLALHSYEQVELYDGSREYYAENEQQIQEVEETLKEFEVEQSRDDTLVDGEEAGQQDLGRSFIVGNNAFIAEDNRPSAVEFGDASDEFMNFRGKVAVDKEADAPGEDAKAPGRGELRQQIASQAMTLQENYAENRSRFSREEAEQARTRNPQLHQQLEQAASQVPSATYLRDDVQFSPDAVIDHSFAQTLSAGGQWLMAQQDSGPGAVSGLDAGSGTAMPWTTAGGLSLDMQLPKQAQELTFTKVGGAPKLTLAVRPRRTWTLGIGSLWSLLWIAIALWAAVTFARAGASDKFWRAMPKLCMAVGLIGFFLIPGPGGWVLFLLFAAGAVGYSFQRARLA